MSAGFLRIKDPDMVSLPNKSNKLLLDGIEEVVGGVNRNDEFPPKVLLLLNWTLLSGALGVPDPPVPYAPVIYNLPSFPKTTTFAAVTETPGVVAPWLPLNQYNELEKVTLLEALLVVKVVEPINELVPITCNVKDEVQAEDV